MPAGTAIREGDLSVHPKTGEDEKDYKWGLDRFLDEARMLARFDHPGIVRVQQFFEAHGTAYIAMEYLEGRTLGALYEEEKVLREQRLRELLSPVLDALEQVHAAEFLHRDIKPGNIMFRSDGMPVLIDFGAARAALAMRSQNMTAIVTPGFSPIEQYSTSAESKQGPWTDIYAIGAVLYRGMTGIVPSDATARTMDDRLVPTGEAVTGRYGKPLTDAVDWALRMRGTDRPQSIVEWREVLEEGRSAPVSTGVRPAAGANAANRGVSESSGKGLWLAAVLGLAVVVAVGGVAYWWDELAEQGSFLSSGTDPAQAELARALAEKAASVRALLGEGKIPEARALLAEAREDGLDEETGEELEAAIREAEARRAAEARAAEVRRLLEECARHGSAKRFAAALSCYREVLAAGARPCGGCRRGCAVSSLWWRGTKRRRRTRSRVISASSRRMRARCSRVWRDIVWRSWRRSTGRRCRRLGRRRPMGVIWRSTRRAASRHWRSAALRGGNEAVEMMRRVRAFGVGRVCVGLTFTAGALAQSPDRTAAEDDVYWESVSGCTDAIEVELYIEEFGEEGRHVAAARACLEKLRKAVPRILPARRPRRRRWRGCSMSARCTLLRTV